MTEDKAPSRLHSMEIPDALWDDVQEVARSESKRLKRYVPASEIMRQGAVREVRRIRKRRGRRTDTHKGEVK